MASSYGHGQSWSPNTVRHRSLDKLPQLAAVQEDTTDKNDFLFDEQQSIVQTLQVTNQMQQLHVHTNAPPRASTQPIVGTDRSEFFLSSYFTDDDESMAEDVSSLEYLKQVINEFMIHPDRRFEHNTSMRWSIAYANQIHYSVVISIDQPSEHV